MPRNRLPEAISIQMAAALLDVHEITIRRWIKRGVIRGAVRLGPQLIRIPRSEVARLRKQKVHSSRGSSIQLYTADSLS